jgi:hypothetical protein
MYQCGEDRPSLSATNVSASNAAIKLASTWRLYGVSTSEEGQQLK